MRRLIQLSALCFAAGLANACKPQEMFTPDDIPTAGVRFVHAVPDTGIMDMKPIDIVENSQSFNVAFRNTAQVFYKNARAGQRHYRVFMGVPFNPDLTAEEQQAIASTVMADVTVNLEAGERYTFIIWGFARPGSSPAMRLDVLQDNPADPGSQVAMRLVNAAAGLGALDGYQYPTGGSVPGTPTWAAVPELSASPYVNEGTGTKLYSVTPAGGGTTLFADAAALAGTAATIDIDAIPGTTVAGSAVSGFVLPRSVAGSQAASFAAPGIFFVWDRRPPRAPGL
jgi:hypothetical protein